MSATDACIVLLMPSYEMKLITAQCMHGTYAVPILTCIYNDADGIYKMLSFVDTCYHLLMRIETSNSIGALCVVQPNTRNKNGHAPNMEG